MARLWPFGKKALTADAGALAAVRSLDWNPFPLLGGGARDRIYGAYTTAQSANYEWLYAHSPAVRTVIDVIVRNIGQLDLRLFEEVSVQERQPRPDHPAAMSLRYPNETTAGSSFIRTLFKDFLIYNNAYALMQEGVSGQIHFDWMPAARIQIIGTQPFSADAYRYWGPDGRFTDLNPDVVLHWKGENPSDPRIGLSPLASLRDVIAEDVALQQALVELANAGLTEPAWVFRPAEAPGWSNEARKGFEEDLANRLRRSSKTPIVMEEGMEMRSFGVSPKDAEAMAARRWAIERVAALYGVPLGMVGLSEDVAAARAQFYADTLPPYCEDFTDMVNQRVLVRVFDLPEFCFEFNLDEKEMGDDRIRTLISAAGAPIMLRDEARARLNLPPLPDEIGSRPVIPSNIQEEDGTSTGKPSVDVMPIQDPNGPPQDGSYRVEPQKVVLQIESAHKAVDGEDQPVPIFDPALKAEQGRWHSNMDAGVAVMSKFFNRLERSLLEGQKMRKAQTTDWQRWRNELTGDLNDFLIGIAGVEGPLYARKLAGEFEVDEVRHYMKATAEGAAEGIVAAVRQEVSDLGVDGAIARFALHAGSSGGAMGASATRWVREEAARQSPKYPQRMKTWVPDTKRHAQFGGDTVPVGEDWPAGFAPGTAPRCRCSMTIY